MNPVQDTFTLFWHFYSLKLGQKLRKCIIVSASASVTATLLPARPARLKRKKYCFTPDPNILTRTVICLHTCNGWKLRLNINLLYIFCFSKNALFWPCFRPVHFSPLTFSPGRLIELLGCGDAWWTATVGKNSVKIRAEKRFTLNSNKNKLKKRTAE